MPARWPPATNADWVSIASMIFRSETSWNSFTGRKSRAISALPALPRAGARTSAGARSMTRRTRQVGDLLREELTDIIRTDVKDPRVGFFTITRVDIGPDLRSATA